MSRLRPALAAISCLAWLTEIPVTAAAELSDETIDVAGTERGPLIAVYSYGSGGLVDNALLTWDADHCCTHAMCENVNDVAFFSALIDELVATRSVDRDRVFVPGLPNGGMMSHRLGRELPDKETS